MGNCLFGRRLPFTFNLSDRIYKVGLPNTENRFFDIYEGDLYSDRDRVSIRLIRDIDIGRGGNEPHRWRSVTLRRIQAEMPLWTDVRHPRVARFLGYAIVGEAPAVIIQHFPNGNVLDWIRRHPNVDRKALVAQIAAGLRYMHTRPQPVVHGCLKPSNVFIDKDGKVKLVDYGLEALLEAQIANTAAADEHQDTMRYHAPELLAGKPANSASDVYSFACVALEILSSLPPFVNLRTEVQVMRAKSAGQVPPSAHYAALPANNPIWGLLERCWHINPARRPTMTQVAAELSAIGFIC